MKIKRMPLLWVAVLAIFVAFLYLPGLSGPFILDDIPNFAHLEQLDQPGASLWLASTTVKSGPLLRPVAMFTFALNYLYGGMEPYGFKLVNLAIHLITGLFIYLCSSRLLRSVIAVERERLVISGMVCALWLASPLFASTVLYAVQRMAQLSALFTLVAIWLYLKWRQPGELQANTVARSVVYLVAILIAWLAGILSKETALVLPYLLLVLEAGFISGPENILKNQVLRRFYFCTAFLPAVAATYYIATHFDSVFSYDHRHFSLVERVLSQSRILWLYIGGLLFPSGAALGVFHDDFEISLGLLEPLTTLIAVIAWVATFIVIVLLWRNTLLRPIAAGFTFFLVAHGLESSIFPLELYFEHRNYLPGFGFWLAVVLSLKRVLSSQKLNSGRRIGLLLFLAYFSIISIATSQRANTWSSRETLVASAYQYHPRSVRANSEMAELAVLAGDLASVETHLQRGIELEPHNAGRYRIMRMIARCLHNAPVNAAELAQFEYDLNFFYAPDQDAKLVLSAITIWQQTKCASSAYDQHLKIVYKKIVELFRMEAAGELDKQYLLRSWKLQYTWARALYTAGGEDLALHLIELSKSIGIKRPLIDLLEARIYIDRGAKEQATASMEQIYAYPGSELRILVPNMESVRAAYKSTFGSDPAAGVER